MLVVVTNDCTAKNPLSHEKLSDFVSLYKAKNSDGLRIFIPLYSFKSSKSKSPDVMKECAVCHMFVMSSMLFMHGIIKCGACCS